MSQSQPMPDDSGFVKAVSKWLASLPNQDAPIGATVEFKVKASDEVTFVRHSEMLAAATRQQAGLDWYSYDKHRPDALPPEDSPPHQPMYGIIERWRSVREFEKNQWGSPHLTAFQSKVFDWIEAPPVLKFFHGSIVRAEVFSTGPYKRDRFQPNGDGTVTDRETELIWLEDANAFGELPWAQALRETDNLSHGLHGLSDKSQVGDWRLPNVNELQSLLDLTNKSGPAISAGNPFKKLAAANYWSSSSVAAFPALGWYVAMAVGPPVFDLKINSMRVWPVRGRSARVRQTGQDKCWDTRGHVIPCEGSGQDAEKARLGAGLPLATPRFQENMTAGVRPVPDGTVTDRVTGLTWLKDADTFGTLNWWDANDKCKQLSAGEKGLNDGSEPEDWRLPDINELRSLEDYGEARPAMPLGHPFVNVRESLVWSSTELASAPTLARFLYVGIGSSVWDHKSVLMGVWPVKGTRKQPC
ncbi:MAG TPA: DUF1566 domain-containing protein [Pirellulaceae bacterium]|nr:DUF1566 domain-containing protein [Pirellulaceae bacterium]